MHRWKLSLLVFALMSVIAQLRCVTSIAAEGKNATDDQTGVTRTGLRWIKPDRLPISAIAFWPDGSKFATASSGRGGAQVWDFTTHASIRSTDDEVIGVECVAVSPDGKSVVISSGGELVLLDGETCRIAKRTHIGAGIDIEALTYSHDGQWIAGTGSTLEAVQLWTPELEPIRQIPVPESTITSISFSRDDKQLAVAVRDSADILICSTATGERVATLTGHTDVCNVTKFSPDGKYLASGARPGNGIGAEGFEHLDTVRLWNVQTGQTEKILLGHPGQVRDLAFSSDGRLLATVGDDQALFVWEIPFGKRYGPLCGHTLRPTTVVFSPDDRTIVTGGNDAIRVWDVQQTLDRPQAFGIAGDELDSWAVHWPGVSRLDLALSADGKTLVTFMPEYGLGVWDYATRKPKRQLPSSEVARFHALSRDARHVIADDVDDRIVAYEIATGKVVWRIDRLRGSDLQFTRDGKLLLGREPRVLEKPREMFGLRATDGSQVFSWVADEQHLTAMALAPNSKWLATAGEENKIKIWRLSNRALVKSLDDWELDGPLCISPNGKRLAALSRKKFAVWDVESGTQLLNINKPDYLGFPMVFLPDQTTLAASASNWITFWDTTTGAQTGVLKGHAVGDEIHRLILAPDGQTLLSGGRYGTIKFWKVP